MKHFFILFTVLFLNSTFAYASQNNFMFQISNYHTQRQSGQTLDVNVRYALKDDVSYNDYPDYLDLRKIVLSYLEPSKILPAETYWEVIAAKIGEDLKTHYNLAGISVQLLVHPNETGPLVEPGFHGPIYTSGDVIPLNEIRTSDRP